MADTVIPRRPQEPSKLPAGVKEKETGEEEGFLRQGLNNPGGQVLTLISWARTAPTFRILPLLPGGSVAVSAPGSAELPPHP